MIILPPSLRRRFWDFELRRT